MTHMPETPGRKPSAEEIAAEVGSIMLPVPKGSWFDSATLSEDGEWVTVHVPSKENEGRGHHIRVMSDNHPFVRTFMPHIVEGPEVPIVMHDGPVQLGAEGPLDQ